MRYPLVLLEIACDWSDDECQEHALHLPDSIQLRAKRYLHSPSRRTLIATRVRLAQVLKALGHRDDQVKVAENGRPYLEGQAYQFNLTHSHQRAALALSADPQLLEGLGVDLEWMPRPVEVVAVGRRFFSPREHAWVGDDPGRFYHIWTRKEAVLKSNGIGLRVSLESFEVLGDEIDSQVTGRPLALHTLKRPDEYLLSWAVARPPSRVRIISDRDVGWLEQLRDELR